MPSSLKTHTGRPKPGQSSGVPHSSTSGLRWCAERNNFFHWPPGDALPVARPCCWLMVGCCLPWLPSPSPTSCSQSVWSLTWASAWDCYCVLNVLVCWTWWGACWPLFHLADISLNSGSALPHVDDSFQFGVTCKLGQGYVLPYCAQHSPCSNIRRNWYFKTAANHVSLS